MSQKAHLKEATEQIVESARGVIAEHLPGVERALHESGGEEPQSITVKCSFKPVGSEDERELVCEVTGQSTLKAAKSVRKLQIQGGQLKLF